MGKRVRISNSSLNSYGTRVMTSGMDVDQYQRNPVLLYMHNRGQIIGYMNDVKIEGDDVTGEPVFDEATDLSKQVKAQFDFGSIRMVSAGIDIHELSDDPAEMLPGQTMATITKSSLFEVSMVDIGANDDAIVLKKDGKVITLSKDGYNPLLLDKAKTENNTQNNSKNMETKTLALLLGLDEKADEAAISAEINKLKAAKEEINALKTEKETLMLAAITQQVDTAIAEKRLTENKKEQFIELGKQVGTEMLKKTLSAMSPVTKPSIVIGTGGVAKATEGTIAKGEYKKLSEVPADELKAMRESDKDTYKKLYKAEYSIDCNI